MRGGGAPNEARHDRHNEQERDRIVCLFVFLHLTNHLSLGTEKGFFKRYLEGFAVWLKFKFIQFVPGQRE